MITCHVIVIQDCKVNPQSGEDICPLVRASAAAYAIARP